LYISNIESHLLGLVSETASCRSGILPDLSGGVLFLPLEAACQGGILPDSSGGVLFLPLEATCQGGILPDLSGGVLFLPLEATCQGGVVFDLLSTTVFILCHFVSNLVQNRFLFEFSMTDHSIIIVVKRISFFSP